MEFRSGNVARDPGQMGMVREKQYLCRHCQLRQNLEPCAGAIVVEVDEKVVGKKWQADARGDRLFGGSETKREKQLVGGAFAHRLDVDRLAPIVAHAEKPWCRRVIVDPKLREPAERQPAEQRARPDEQRILPLLPVTFYRPPQRHRLRAIEQIGLSLRGHLRSGLLGVSGRRRGITARHIECGASLARLACRFRRGSDASVGLGQQWTQRMGAARHHLGIGGAPLFVEHLQRMTLAAAHRLCLNRRERLAIGSHPARRLHHLIECLNSDAAKIGKDGIQAGEGRPARRLGCVYLARTASPFGIEFGTGAGAGPRLGDTRPASSARLTRAFGEAVLPTRAARTRRWTDPAVPL